jgi:glycosyltransferase involved in cell wall biosynthesis
VPVDRLQQPADVDAPPTRSIAPELSLIMPVYNEEATVAAAIEEVLAVQLPVNGREVIVVDDGSSDRTNEILSDARWGAAVKVVSHPSNRGKGAAIRTGLAHARGSFTGVVDADRELDPADLVNAVRVLVTERPDAVFGVRRFPRSTARQLRYWLGNRGVTVVANLLYGARIADIMTGYKIMSTALFAALPLKEDRFGIEPEVTAWLLRAGADVRQVPVAYVPRARKAGKKLTMLDGFRVMRTLVRCRLSPMPGVALHQVGGTDVALQAAEDGS